MVSGINKAIHQAQDLFITFLSRPDFKVPHFSTIWNNPPRETKLEGELEETASLIDYLLSLILPYIKQGLKQKILEIR